MTIEPFVRLESTLFPLPIDNVDTDQIIPARFLKTTVRDGLGANLFADWRFDEAGEPRVDFALNRPEYQGANVLVAGDNFGCGSSREHAPWALLDFGIRAVIAPRFADIFKNNALKNGLLPIEVERALVDGLLETLELDSKTRVVIDLEAGTLTINQGAVIGFEIDGFARHCLLAGIDQLGYLLSQDPAISAFEAQHPVELNTQQPAGN